MQALRASSSKALVRHTCATASCSLCNPWCGASWQGVPVLPMTSVSQPQLVAARRWPTRFPLSMDWQSKETRNTHTLTRPHMRSHIHYYAQTRTNACILIYISYAHAHTHAHARTHTVHTHAHTHTHTWTHEHTHTNTQRLTPQAV